MVRAGLPQLAASLTLIAGCVAGVSAARAQTPDPVASEAERTRASALFEEARQRYDAGDFAAAAAGFEQAYAVAPHHAASWNAARAWHRAGDLPRAAMLYQRYLREAPWDAPDRDAAGVALADLRPSLGRIQVNPPGVEGVTVDGRPLAHDEIWVVPGAHIVESRAGVTKVDVTAGAIVSVAIEPARPAPAPPEPRPSRAKGENTTRDDGGWPAWGILPFAGATILAGGGLVASGIDTENLHDELVASGYTSAYALDNGRFAMHRTNVLVAVTAGLGAVTLGVALFAVDWNGEADGGRVVGLATPHGAAARGSF